MNARRSILTLLLSLVVVAGVEVTGAFGASSDAGKYSGKATKGTTSPTKSTKVVFEIKVTSSCPMPDGTFKRALCLEWTPGISMPVTCEYWNSADPVHRPAKERRSVPYSAAVSKSGHVDISSKTTGSNYHDATRLTVSVHGGKATGKVTYTAGGRSFFASKDCSGKLEFKAKRR